MKPTQLLGGSKQQWLLVYVYTYIILIFIVFFIFQNLFIAQLLGGGEQQWLLVEGLLQRRWQQVGTLLSLCWNHPETGVSKQRANSRYKDHIFQMGNQLAAGPLIHILFFYNFDLCFISSYHDLCFTSFSLSFVPNNVFIHFPLFRQGGLTRKCSRNQNLQIQM